MQDILVHAARHRERDPAAAHAARVAAALGASLTAVHVLPPLPVLPEYDVPGVLADYTAWREGEERAARAAGPVFEAWASSLGVPDARWVVADGHLPALLRHAGRWHDLLVLGLGGDDPWRSGTGVAELVLSSALPCLLVPADAGAAEPAQACVAVAWNGAAEAIGALHAALPLLRAARRVVVLAGEPVPAPAGMVPFELDGWAARHGVHLEYRMLDAAEDTGAALLAAAGAVGADLLVAGAYGHSRLAEWALGGVTRHLVRHSAIPLLLRH
jgi:nucleotide-binding universal stress UspA family protein